VTTITSLLQNVFMICDLMLVIEQVLADHNKCKKVLPGGLQR
jgi:hypothetical protein